MNFGPVNRVSRRCSKNPIAPKLAPAHTRRQRCHKVANRAGRKSPLGLPAQRLYNLMGLPISSNRSIPKTL